MLADHLGTRILGSVRVNLRNLRHLMPSWLPLRCHSVGLLRQLSPAVLAAFRQQHFHGRSPRPWESGGDGALGVRAGRRVSVGSCACGRAVFALRPNHRGKAAWKSLWSSSCAGRAVVLGDVLFLLGDLLLCVGWFFL